METKELESIGKKHNAKFKIIDNNYSSLQGATLFYLKIYLQLHYKNHVINVKIITYQRVATVVCVFNQKKDSLTFEIDTREYIISLLFRKDMYFFKNGSPQIKSFFNKNIHYKKMKSISNETGLQPLIKGFNDDDHKYNLTTTYGINTKKWGQVIDPILYLYKDFIDEFF